MSAVRQLASGPVKRHGELADALVGGFLAFGVGVGEEAADGEQEHGAQAQAEPRGDHEARGFADETAATQNEEKAKAAQDSVGGAEAEADQGESREEDVDAHLHAHPSAQRD